MADSEDITLFAESARRALQDLSPVAAMRSSLCSPEALAHETWRSAVELGWTGICVPQASGGLALGIEYLCALGVEVGRSLAAGPFGANLALAPALAAGGGDAEALAAILPAIVNGDIVLTDWCRVQTVLDEQSLLGHSGGVQAECAVVDNASVATHALLVSGRASASSASLSCALLDLSLPNIRRHDVVLFDPTSRGCSLAFEKGSAPFERQFNLTMTSHEMDTALLPVRLFATAQSVGVAQRALETAVEHVIHRKQFGQALGAFQAIKHKLADVHVANEKARVLMQYAARELADEQPQSRLDVHSAWLAGTRAAIGASQTCVQMLGAMGFSWEHPAHLLLKRARSLAAKCVGVVDARQFIAQTLTCGGQLQSFDEPVRDKPAGARG